MQLILTEKPSQGRALAQALEIKGRGDGCIEGQGVVVTWCIGHLVELCPPEEYSKELAKWNLDTLPILPVVFKTRASKGTFDQYKKIKSLLLRKDVTEVVCATDSGREGELIFDLVYRQSGCKKPVKRLWTASLTPEALREAYAHLRPAKEFEGLRASAHCRSQADWIVGLNATRAQTLSAQQAGEIGVWTVGRVQTPTLAMIVERDKAIKEFVSRPFWQIEAQFQAKEGKYEGRWFYVKGEKIITQIFQQKNAELVLARIQDQPARVESVEGSIEKRRPPQLFDLTTLQRDANKRFGYSAEKTLQLAQGLYEKGVLSYPRTNSRYLTEAEEKKLPSHLKNLPEPYASLFAAAPRRKLGKAFVDAKKVEDHHAIIPTGQEATLGTDETKIFDLVLRRTISAYYDEEVVQKTTVITAIGEDQFRSVGRVVIQMGWTVVENSSQKSKIKKKNEGEDGQHLPPLKKGDLPKVLNIDCKESQTEPPKPHSEGDLLGAMETAGKTVEDEGIREALKDCGLGTPATRASIIEGLIKRELIVRQGKALIPTPKGSTLIETLKSDLLKSPELTGQWEQKLERVRRGQLSPEEFMHDVRTYTSEFIANIKALAGNITRTQPLKSSHREVGRCPQCTSPLLLKSWEGKFYTKCSAENDPNCKVSYSSDAQGKPKGGFCKKCKGPIRLTKAKSKVCLKCGSWA